MAANRKVGKRKPARKAQPSWEAKELGDINKYWKPELMTREYQRKLSRKST